jgi:hypothetical protein
LTVRGDPVVLRGVGLVRRDAPSIDGEPDPGQADVLDGLLGLGPQVLRLAIDRDQVIGASATSDPIAYLAMIDDVVSRASAAGCYTMLSLRRLGSITFGTLPDPSGLRVPNPIAPQPDHDALGMWRTLGQRYADEPAVLFELFAAPHRALPDDITGMDTDWQRWSLFVRLAVAELHRAHPRALCVATGLEWGTDLSGFPVRGTADEPIPNLVYGARIVEGGAEPPLRAVARRLALLVTELDCPAASLNAKVASLASLGVGWIVADRPDRPLLGVVRRGRREPTGLGTAVRRAFASVPDRPVLQEPLQRTPTHLALAG